MPASRAERERIRLLTRAVRWLLRERFDGMPSDERVAEVLRPAELQRARRLRALLNELGLDDADED